MADIVSREARSRMMAGIRGKNTKPEIQIRRALFGKGFRYRLHTPALPGKPDIVFPKYRAVVFIHGCFWHCHSCTLFKWPQSNITFWKNKLEKNRTGDDLAEKRLRESGWRVAIVWECALKSRGPSTIEAVAEKLTNWLVSSQSKLVVERQISKSV
jgi:DNA mismatch endonuclease, patch repair protein